MSGPIDIAAALEAVLAEVASAGERIAGGKPADITDLPDRMTPICAAIAALPREQATAHAVVVKTLVTALDKIAAQLRERQQALRQRLDQLDATPS